MGGARAQDRAESASAVCTSLYHLVICTLQVPNLGRLPRGHSCGGVNQHKQGYRVLLFLCLHKFSRFLFISYPQGSPFPVRQRLGFWTCLGREGGEGLSPMRCSSSLHHNGRMNLSWFCQRAERPGRTLPGRGGPTPCPLSLTSTSAHLDLSVRSASHMPAWTGMDTGPKRLGSLGWLAPVAWRGQLSPLSRGP